MPAVVVAHQTFVMVRKEVTFGVNPGAATIAPGFSAFTLQGKNTSISRPNGRKRPGVSLSPAGPYDAAGNLDPNPDPDTLAPFIAWAMGAQTAPVAATYYTTALTSTSAVGSSIALAVTAGTGTDVLVGDSVIVGAGTANVETCVVSAHAANTVTVSNATKTHAIGDTVQALSTTAFFSTCSYGTTLPSFLLEYNRGYDCWDFSGTTIDSMKLGCAPGQLLVPSFGLVAATEALQGSPATPAFSTAFPLHWEAPFPQTGLLNGVLFNGAVLPAGTILKKWDASLANGLEKTFKPPGQRTVAAFPVGQRKATVSATFSFADASVYDTFLGTTSGPGPSIAGVSLAIPIASLTDADSTVGRTVPYSITVRTPNLYPTGDPVAGKQYGSLEQVFTADAAETPGNGNDLQIDLVTSSATAY